MSSSPDIIKDASDALRPISDRGITVMQGWYDKDIHDRHVTLWDLGKKMIFRLRAGTETIPSRRTESI